jgi:hypothetical protein
MPRVGGSGSEPACEFDLAALLGESICVGRRQPSGYLAAEVQRGIAGAESKLVRR